MSSFLKYSELEISSEDSHDTKVILNNLVQQIKCNFLFHLVTKTLIGYRVLQKDIILELDDPLS